MFFTLKFLKHLPLYDTDQPYTLHGFDDVKAEDITNCEYEDIDGIKAQDIREIGHRCFMDRQGFETMRAPSSFKLSAAVLQGETPDANTQVKGYLEETMAMVKEKMNAMSVFTIDWRYRRNNTSTEQPAKSLDFRKEALKVATTVHTDFSPDGGQERIRMHLNDTEWARIESGHLVPKIVNVWRPLEVVTNAPLVISDRRTVDKLDLVEVDQVMTDKVTKTSNMYHQSGQQWFWLSNQTPEEIFIFVSWAPSQDHWNADYSPHAAAYLHRSNQNLKPRESVEVRMIVLHERKNA